tara:strand:+ start:179 stop:355 length:177 start_codon:yes stop_codon:yes gene_type:complete
MEQMIKALVRQLITDSVNCRMVSILEAGNELAALLPKEHRNQQIVHNVAWEMHQQAQS